MWMNNFDTNNDCVLIIGKHDDIVPHDKMYDEMWFNSRAYEYNHKTKERIFTGVYYKKEIEELKIEKPYLFQS